MNSEPEARDHFAERWHREQEEFAWQLRYVQQDLSARLISDKERASMQASVVPKCYS